MTEENLETGQAPQQVAPGPWRRARLSLGIAALFALIASVLYAILEPGKETAEVAACAEARDVAARLAPLVHGEVAALSVAAHTKPLPDLVFDGPDGAKTKLSQFRGHVLLLNLWATWCVPCRQEMPALDRLQAKLGSQDFEVVAINIDTARLERPKAFLNEVGVKNLAFYADATADVFQKLKQNGKIIGLPTTFLIGKDGCEIASMAGPAQWDSGEALALITAAKE
jgi:thiol-disulfide isomerase/thioredoxin